MAAVRKNIQQKIEQLRDMLRYHEHRYYVLDDPEAMLAINLARSMLRYLDSRLR